MTQITINDAIDFKSSAEPLVSLWSIGDLQAYGSLIWLDGKPVLTLMIEVDKEIDPDFDKTKIPILKATKPPIQATIYGIVSKFGTITLECCARYNVHISQNIRTNRTIYKLDFLPSAVWIGAPKNAIEEQIVNVVATDTRLVGFFGSPGLKIHRDNDPKAKKVFETLGNPESIWALHAPLQHKIQLGETGWLLSLYTDLVETTSGTEGHILRSAVNIRLHAPKPTNISEASHHLARIEEILSIFSIEAFTFQLESYSTDEFETITLIWRLGENHSLFQPPMKHQILVNLSDPATLKAVCKQWFSATPTVSLSRWLFVHALKEMDDGFARFVAVAQAFEVLGKELRPHGGMPRKQLQKAVKLIQEALISGNFEEDFIVRVVQLVRSSNKSSYRDVLYHMLNKAAQRLQFCTNENIENFCKIVSNTRNDIIHMNDNDNGKLNEAFSRINKLSLKLCFWYAVCQADQMQLNMPSIGSFLFNNRNARHGLQNELLE